MEPRFGKTPVTFDGRGSNAHNVCCSFNGETAEIAQLDHTGLLRIQCSQGFECVVERDQLRTTLDRTINVFIQREFLKVLAPLFRIMPARMIHEQATHYLCSNPEKMSAVLPVYPCLIDEPEIGLMNQRRRLQGMIRPFPPQIIRRELSQFIVDDG